jgi:Holliday junction DNA helicase RuvA
MITRITGILNRVLDDEIRLQVGPVEYQVLIPECVRRNIQAQTQAEITLFTSQYFEGNQMASRFIPRLIGFTSEAELEFFDLFCTVEKIGVRKALKALARPVREIADAIQRQDAKWLTTLPGIGPASAEQVVATLRRKVTRFALMPTATEGAAQPPTVMKQSDILAEVYTALVALGHNPGTARDLLDKAAAGGKKFDSVEDVFQAIYARSSS